MTMWLWSFAAMRPFVFAVIAGSGAYASAADAALAQLRAQATAIIRRTSCWSTAAAFELYATNSD